MAGAVPKPEGGAAIGAATGAAIGAATGAAIGAAIGADIEAAIGTDIGGAIAADIGAGGGPAMEAALGTGTGAIGTAGGTAMEPTTCTCEQQWRPHCCHQWMRTGCKHTAHALCSSRSDVSPTQCLMTAGPVVAATLCRVFRLP